MWKGNGFCEFGLESLLSWKAVVPLNFVDKEAELFLMPATNAPLFIVHNGLATVSVSIRCGRPCQFCESCSTPRVCRNGKHQKRISEHIIYCVGMEGHCVSALLFSSNTVLIVLSW
jgi:hypothetical protein